MARTPSFKILDAVLIVLVAAATVITAVRIYGGRGEERRLVIEAPGNSWIYSLDTDRTVEIPGALGVSTVHIAGKTAHIDSSPCPNQTCVASPPISRKGEWSACLPNQVIIRIEGSEGEMDAVGY